MRKQAKTVYRRWQQTPNLPGLRFKRINDDYPPYFSVRVTRDFRAVGELQGETMYWDFIGNHTEYKLYISSL